MSNTSRLEQTFYNGHKHKNAQKHARLHSRHASLGIVIPAIEGHGGWSYLNKNESKLILKNHTGDNDLQRQTNKMRMI